MWFPIHTQAERPPVVSYIPQVVGTMRERVDDLGTGVELDRLQGEPDDEEEE